MSGRYKMSRKGYRQRHCPGHPRADTNGYVMEHILVFEESTGVSVPLNCCIHHLNGNKTDNRIENLCMMDMGAHTAFHHTGRKRSNQTREKMSAWAKDRFSDQRNHPFYKAINVSEMMEKRKAGAKVMDLCREYGISKSTYYKKMEEENYGT